MIDEELKASIRDAVGRILSGRERVPGDLPYPPSIFGYAVASVFPDEDPKRFEFTRQGLNLSKTIRQIYLAGWFAGRECDAQLTRQLAERFDADGAHPYFGVAACLVCDGAPGDERHG